WRRLVGVDLGRAGEQEEARVVALRVAERRIREERLGVLEHAAVVAHGEEELQQRGARLDELARARLLAGPRVLRAPPARLDPGPGEAGQPGAEPGEAADALGRFAQPRERGIGGDRPLELSRELQCARGRAEPALELGQVLLDVRARRAG